MLKLVCGFHFFPGLSLKSIDTEIDFSRNSFLSFALHLFVDFRDLRWEGDEWMNMAVEEIAESASEAIGWTKREERKKPEAARMEEKLIKMADWLPA